MDWMDLGKIRAKPVTFRSPRSTLYLLLEDHKGGVDEAKSSREELFPRGRRGK
uniref:Uncharacterized protein n=1 Tax=Arundo donax TaxID=35708 RepID=A0A0A9C3B9_ARUDO